MTETLPIKDLIRAQLDERRIAEEAEEFSGSLVKFIKAGWAHLKPETPYRHNWHIDAFCEHLQAVSYGEIKRLQIWVPPQTTKPVDEKALILMGDGSRKHLAEVEVGDTVISHTGRAREVLKVHQQGLLETVRIETESGRVTHTALDHPFLTPSGWKQAGDLGAGDVLGTVAMAGCQYEGSDRSLEEMRLIGYFIGDGNCTVSKGGGTAANITCFDPVQGADIIACAEALGFSASYALGKARRYNLSQGVRAWLHETGLAGHTSWTKRVPNFVFSSSQEHIAHFIGAYFACDGTLMNRKGRDGKPRSDLSVIFSSVNRPLLQDIQHLLLRLGVRSRIRMRRGNGFKGPDYISWLLIIYSVDDTSKFIERIPVIGVKAKRLADWGMQRSRFDEMLLPDTVISVEPSGLRKCRCLTVITDQTFTADDLVVHNSIQGSVCWPAWEWTFAPGISYWTASYSTDLSGRLSAMSMLLMKTPWYQARWGERWKFIRDAEHFFGNDRGGIRLATSPTAEMGTGYHGDRILIDDAINAKTADAQSKVLLMQTNEWYDSTVSSRGIGPDHARVNIQQRLHEGDLAAHMLEIEDWVVLALPELYWPGHPYAWRGQRKDIKSEGSTLGPGDPRREDGELLWPEYRPASLSEANMKHLGYRAAGQYQQWPEPREGALLKRADWRFYDPDLFNEDLPKRELAGYRNRRPKFTRIVQSIDTPLKDKESNDHVSIQAWGVKGADRYLLDIRTDHMSYPQARRAIIEQAAYVRKLYPRIAHTVLIENAGYGVELNIDLKRKLTGVKPISASQDGDKVARAEAASSDLESGNCWLPGIGGGPDETLGPAKKVSGEVHEFIEECVVSTTQLVTREGLRRADQIEEGDYVLTHRGRFRPITRISSRWATDLVTIKAKTLEPLTLTPDHPALAMRIASSSQGRRSLGMTWKNVGELKPRAFKATRRGPMEPSQHACDGLVIPLIDRDEVMEEIDLRDWYEMPIKTHRSYAAVDDGESISLNTVRSQPLRYKQQLDHVFGRFCGLYLAEGSYAAGIGRATWSFSAAETDLASEVCETLSGRLGIRANDYVPAHAQNVRNVFASLPRLHSWFETFGFGAANKRIPWWAWQAPPAFHRGLVEGWLEGDGHEGSGSTASRNLAWGMRLIATGGGVWGTLHTGHRAGQSSRIHDLLAVRGHDENVLNLSHRNGSTTAVLGEDVLGFWIQDMEKSQPAQVWNFSVEEDESYVTTGGTLHNCARFPHGNFDDRVDAWSQCQNWLRSKIAVPGRTSSPFSRRRRRVAA